MSKLEKLVQGIAVASLVTSSFGVIATEKAAFSSSDIVQTKQAKQNKKSKIIVDNKFRFELQKCYRQSGGVTCALLITNLAAEDRNLVLYGDSYGETPRIFDYSGNVYYGSGVEFANLRSNSGIEVTLIQGIPVKGFISYGVNSNTRNFAALELYYYNYNTGKRKLLFRNINLS